MNTLLRFAAVGAAVAALSACASTHTQLAKAPAPAPAQHEPGTLIEDTVYMGRVEHIARSRGVRVRWVNPPLKRTVAARQ
jgi:hypothetical protein